MTTSTKSLPVGHQLRLLHKALAVITAMLFVCFGVAIGQTTDAAASSLSSKTYVSYRGVDTNPCSRVFPCRTITHALSMTAASGVVDIIDDGDYDSFAANQSVTVAAAPGVLATISSGLFKVISAAAGNIVLKNLHVNIGGGGNGVFITSTGQVSLEQMFLSGAGDGVIVESTGTVNISNSTLENLQTGIFVDFGASTVSIADVKIHGGLFGLLQGDGVVTLKSSVVSNAGGAGIFLTGGQLALENSVLAGNQAGMQAGQAGCTNCASAVLSNSTITNSKVWGIAILGASVYTRGNNTFFGNHPDVVDGTLTPIAAQ